jgi:hypothetical protein
MTSSGVNSSSISSISASSKITPKLSSSGSSFSSTSSTTSSSSLDGAISINSSLLILSLISGEMSSGFFTFFF